MKIYTLGIFNHECKFSIGETAHLPLPLPNINPNLLSVNCCWIRGWVGAQLLRYRHSSSFFSSHFQSITNIKKNIKIYLFSKRKSLNGRLCSWNTMEGRRVFPIPRLCFGQCDSCGFRCIKLMYGNSLMILFRMSNDANCDFKLLASNKKWSPWDSRNIKSFWK